VFPAAAPPNLPSDLINIRRRSLSRKPHVVKVEDRLFRVHRHFLAENSLIFSSMFSLPRDAAAAAAAQVSSSSDSSSTAAELEGTSDANPIYLSGVKELEFETLLRFFYKR